MNENNFFIVIWGALTSLNIVLLFRAKYFPSMVIHSFLIAYAFFNMVRFIND